MKPKSTLRAFLLGGPIAAILASYAHAATYYWDTDGTTPGFGGASGTWGTSAFWSTNAAGTAATANSVTATGDTINFGTSTLGLGAGTISVGTVNSGNINFGSLSGAIELTGGTITLAAAETITVNNPSNTIGSALAGAATSLTKAGVGTLTLNGSTSNTFTGGLIINGGTMALDYSNLATPADLLASGKSLTLKGGNLTLKGKAGGGIATTQTFGNVTVNPYGATLLIDPNGGDSTTLTLGTLDPTIVGSTLTLGTALGAGSGTVTITTTTNKKTDGSYGGRVVFANGTGYDWATTSSVGSPYTLEAYSGYTAMVTSGTDTANSRITASSTLSGALATNSLKIENPAASQNLNLAGNTLTLTNGGLLVTGTNAFQISGSAGSKLIGLNGSGAFDLIVQQYNSGGLDIGVEISNNGAVATALTKAGTGSLTLSGANTFTGGLFINSGSVTLANSGALNTSTPGSSENAVAIANGGNLSLNGNSVTVRMLNSSDTSIINGGTIQNASATPATLTVGNSANASSTFAGIIQDGSGGGALTLAKSGTNTLTLSGANTYSGGTVLNAGTISFSSNGNLGAAGTGITLNGNATLSNSTGTTLVDLGSRAITLNGSAIATITGTARGNIAIGGAITGSGGVTMTNGTFWGKAALNSTANTFSGPIAVTSPGDDGNNVFSINSIADGSGYGNIVLTNNTGDTDVIGLDYGAGGANGAGGGGAIVPLTLNHRQIVVATDKNNLLNNSSDQTLTVNTDIGFSGAGPRTIQFGVHSRAGSGLNTFNGLLQNNGGDALSVKVGGGTWVLANANNSYTGATTLSGASGILQVTKLANGGLNSNIGASSNAAGNLLFGTGSRLRYVGTGDSTDRGFTINGTSNGHNAIIEASGSPGALSFTNTGTPGYGTTNQTRTLTLTGNNTGANTLAATLTNNGTGALSVNKLSPGRWVLTGTNTYTGATTISNGVLQAIEGIGIATNSGISLDGGVFQSSGTFTRLVGAVSTAGSTAYNMTANGGGFSAIGGKFTVTLDNTASVRNWGTTVSTSPLVGTLKFGSPSSNAEVEMTNNINLNGANRTIEVTAGVGADFATLSGVLSNSTGTAGFTKTGTGKLVLTNSNTYNGTTTINDGVLAITGATQATSAITFGGGVLGLTVGSPVTAASATVDFTGATVTVTGTPAPATLLTVGTMAGGDTEPTLSPSIPGYELDVVGNELRLISTGAPVGFAAWQAANSTTGGRDEDHDGDGVDNGTEHFLGGTANTTGFTALPSVVNNAGTLSITWTKAGTYTGVYATDYVVETSATLAGPWTTETLGVNVTITGNDVKYTFPGGPAYSGKNFARLRVTGP